MGNRVSTIARQLEGLVRKVFPGAVESRDGAEIGFGFGTGYKDLVFVVSRQKTHVNLGIARGAELQSKFPLLEGRGKVHRHVKITALDDLTNPELTRLMQAALKAARARLEPRR